MSAASILSLPLHIVCNILKNLDNAKSLQAAIASHSIFYRTLQEYEVIITRAVIDAEISPSLYPYALAAYAIRSQPSFDYEYICNVLYDMQYRILRFPSRGKVDFRCLPSLRAAIYISKLHEAVLFFTKRIGEEAISRGVTDLGLVRFDRRELSANEEFIIGRALYRFQIFSEIVMACDGARDASGSLPAGIFNKSFVTEVWLGPFPPWVNEQLASIYDYLLHFSTSKLDRVAKHDIEWGVRGIEYLSKYSDNPYARGLVVQGLPFLRRVDTAAQYGDFQRILKDKGILYSTRGLDKYLERCIDWTIFGLRTATNTNHFTDKGFTRIATDQRYHTWRLFCKRMGAKFSRNRSKGGESVQGPHAFCNSERVHLRHEEVDDSSRFPCQAWKIAHQRLDIRKSVYNRAMRIVRLSVYVLLDEPESEFYLFGLMEHLIPGMIVADRTLVSNRVANRDRIEASWAARLEIYKKGGRGYWSEDGVNAIEWTGKWVDEDGIKKLRNDYVDMTIPREPDRTSDELSTPEAE